MRQINIHFTVAAIVYNVVGSRVPKNRTWHIIHRKNSEKIAHTNLRDVVVVSQE